jgi:carbon-monoxide dehydrogenase small subunit
MDGTFIVNDKELHLNFDPTHTLLRVLRDNGYTEVKQGCDEGTCGTCVLLINGKLLNSCQVLAASVMNKDIKTVKGIGDIHSPHIIQKTFSEVGAVQCGFCTPAKVLTAYALLSKNLSPTDDEIKYAMAGTFCRCTGYVKIIEAVRLSAKRMKEHG